jgi:hypothetical protein
MNLNQISFTLFLSGMALAFQALAAPGPTLKDLGDAVATEKANGIEVKIYGEVTATIPGMDKPINLFKTGYGPRKKKLGVVTAPLYVMESFIDNKNALDSNQPLTSLRDSKVKALRLSIVFPLTAGQLRQSFTEGLERNGVLNKPVIKRLVESIKSGLTPRQVATFVSVTKGNVDDVYITLPNDVLHEDSENLGQDFWSIWFGIVKGDVGLEALRPQLIKR